MESIDVNALHGQTVDAVKPKLAELNKEQLEQLRALEVAEGEAKARSTLLTAIDARLEALAAQQGIGSDDTGSESTGSESTGGESSGDEATGTAQGGGALPSDGGAAQTAEPGAAPADDLQAALQAEQERLRRDADIEAAAQELSNRSVAVAQENAVRLFAEAAQAPKVDRRDVLADGAELYFSEGESFLAGMLPVSIAPKALRMEGDRLVVDQAVDFPPIAPSARIEAVWLHSDGDWAVAQLMQPLVIGGGHEARLPAGHIAFNVK